MNPPLKIQNREAFTLIEMIIAITVFTIFIGFTISTYLTFHRADQDALSTRSMVMEGQALLNELSDAMRENKIDYEAYVEGEQSLYLISPDGTEKKVYTWDSEEETLSVQRFDGAGTVLTEEQVLHSESLAVSFVSFSVFPAENPYENRTEESIQYQPMVRFKLMFTTPGRMDEELSFELQTTVTSRFYQ